MGRKLLKRLLNIAFLVLVFSLTMWSVFYGADLGKVLTHIRGANLLYILPGIACVVLFILGEALITWYLLRTLGNRISFWHCSLYAFIGFFYSAITPSASGGQPMQLLAMRKDDIPVGVSTVVLAIVTITYKLVLVVIGIAVMVLQPASLMVYLEPVEWLMYVGLALNIVFIAGLLLLVFQPNALRSFAYKLLHLVHRIRPFRDLEKQTRRLDRITSQYQGTADFFKHHQRIIVRVLFVTFIQRYLLFFVTWLTYRAFSLQGTSVGVITGLQAMISVAVDMLPLPGGMGISENLFLEVFQPIFGEAFLLPGMVVSRGLAYYTQLVISAVMTVVSMISIKDKTKLRT